MKKNRLSKLLITFVLLSVIVTVVSGCGSRQDSKTERTTFTVGFDAEFPPYGYKDSNGNYVGFDLDLAEEVTGRRELPGFSKNVLYEHASIPRPFTVFAPWAAQLFKNSVSAG